MFVTKQDAPRSVIKLAGINGNFKFATLKNPCCTNVPLKKSVIY